MIHKDKNKSTIGKFVVSYMSLVIKCKMILYKKFIF